MIGSLSGNILDISATHILIQTHSGIGYDIFINEVTYSHIVSREEVFLYVYHNITENSQSLYGFETLDEKKLFTELIKISGVGGKVALQILSLGKERLFEAIQNDDTKTIESVKGIGKKMAEKIILELKDKDFVKSYVSHSPSSHQRAEQIQLPATTVENITTTLQNMGYSSRDIERVLQTLPDEMTTLEEILPYMIREL